MLTVCAGNSGGLWCISDYVLRSINRHMLAVGGARLQRVMNGLSLTGTGSDHKLLYSTVNSTKADTVFILANI